MQFTTSLSLLSALAAAAQAAVYISNEGHDCATRVTDANGNTGCTLHEIIDGTAIKIVPGSTIVEGTAQAQVTEIQVFGTSTFINGSPVGGSAGSDGSPTSGSAQITDIQINDGTTVINGQTVGATPASSGSHNAAPVPTRGPSLELAMAAIAAGGFAAAF